MIGVLLLAAGSGTRMHGEVDDKLLHPIAHSNAFSLCCTSFLHSGGFENFVITYRDTEQLPKLKECWEKLFPPITSTLNVRWVPGGAKRQDSVLAGLRAFDPTVTHVLIHDSARPFIRPYTISQVVQEISKNRAIALARPLKDTLRVREENSDNSLTPTLTTTVNRKNHWLMETPQGAPKDWLIEGLEKAKDNQVILTDDMAAIEILGHPVGLIEPDYPNPKITTPDDFSYAEFLLQS